MNVFKKSSQWLEILKNEHNVLWMNECGKWM